MRHVAGLGSSLLLGAALIAWLALPGLSGAKPPDGKGKGGGDDGVIHLTGTFRDAGDDGCSDDNLCSDGLGPYVSGVKGVEVEITKDGDFRFVLGVVNTKKKGSVKRSIVLWFDDEFRAGDSGAIAPDPVFEPLNGIWFRTMGFAGGNPSLNFRLMNPGDVRDVRLHFPFSTTERSDFWLRFDPEDAYNRPEDDCVVSTPPGCGHTGIVQVTASDEDGDGLVDRWVLVPLPESDPLANLVSHTSSQQTGHQIVDFGDFRMPFELTLDRLE